MSLRRGLLAAGERWDRFWFAPLDPLPLTVFRTLFGAGLLVFYAIRLADFAFIFGADGIVPAERVSTIMPAAQRPWLPLGVLAATPAAAWVFNAVLLLATAAFTMGRGGRPAILAACFSHLVLLHRCPINIYGADQLVTCWLVYLCLASATEPGARAGDAWSTMATRLIQIQLCVIYAVTGISKLRGGTWLFGDALWHAFANGQFVWMDFGVLRHVPTLVAVASVGIVLWEVYFPALVWPRGLRRYTLVLGFLMHLGIGVFMNLHFFSWFMLCAYVLFADPAWLRRMLTRQKGEAPTPA